MNESGDATKHGDGLAPVAEGEPPLPLLTTPPTTAANADDLTTRALKFMSTASKETIGGIAVGLAACTYLVLGRVGLVLIGAFGGILLHASWEGQTILVGSVEDARQEKGLDIVKRILDFREREAAACLGDDSDTDDDGINNSFDSFRPETASALNNLVDAVIRDYVKWWYSPVLPKENTFPAASREILTKFLLSISQHLTRKRPADTFLDFLTNSSSIVIVFLDELSSALSGPQNANIPAAEAVYTYLSANPDSNLANVLSVKQQTRKFKMVADDILQNFLEKSAYECDPAKIFLREILAGVVLEMTLASCSKPEWINGWIVYFLEEGEPDLSQAIDAGVTNRSSINDAFDGFDGNIGSVGLPKEERKEQDVKKHKKRLSRAEEAMEEAMNEAKRLSELIAQEEKKRDNKPRSLAEEPPASSSESERTSTLRVALDSPIQETHPITTDRNKSLDDSIGSLLSPKSSNSIDIGGSPLSTKTKPSVTNVEQILVSPNGPSTLQPQVATRPQTASLTLHNANIIIHDDSNPSDKGRLRSKPAADYLVQIEPESSQHPGWMIVRKYPDFETLHEVLRRIANISGVAAFTEQHHTLPNWKEHTKSSLRGELERYLRDACWYQPLAESEGMKRFLEKDQGQMQSSGSTGKAGFGWPTPSAFENMGKGMLDVLTSAPKGAAEGGKVVLGGVTGVFSNIGSLGQKKSNSNMAPVSIHNSSRASISTLPRSDNIGSVTGARKGRTSEDSLRTPSVIQTQSGMIPSMERRPSYNSIAEDETDQVSRSSQSARSSFSGRHSATHSRDPSRAPNRVTPLSSPTHGSVEDMRLPPPPSDIADDYASPTAETSTNHSRIDSSAPTTRTSTSTAPSIQQSPGRQSLSIPRRTSVQATTTRKPRKESTPLTEQETRVAVELMFAVINELYTLSSAWNIRRTLLNAAKTFLLRPGNPSLSSIQSLIQDSVIASNTSDAGIASHLRKLRENTLPTEEELKAWPAEMTPEEKERLKVKARKLLVERGVPAALTGVMGQAATGEAMGRVFDCLQVEEVARGLMFGLLLQGVRAVTQ
ncbi:hypothetical protein BP6252_13393 [Coleophoma cylindrospora]|uniref:PXA domain-containing protein n=1 Tax=Coleophoma cylindrospora TaxID=1849047 RepID=A0A3D8Q830_9HELO|nr:hypothetical protein BP6252_13393 [Coleophoma cylindrospora]